PAPRRLSSQAWRTWSTWRSRRNSTAWCLTSWAAWDSINVGETFYLVQTRCDFRDRQAASSAGLYFAHRPGYIAQEAKMTTVPTESKVCVVPKRHATGEVLVPAKLVRQPIGVLIMQQYPA